MTPTPTRVALVAGGGSGIGAAAALELARGGAVVVVADPGVGTRGEPLGERTAAATVERIEAEGGTARASMVSVTDQVGVQGLVDEIVRDFGRLDVVFNPAGISGAGGWSEGLEDDWRLMLDVHLNGYLNLLAAALPVMVEAGYGRFVGVTSGAGWRGGRDGGAYALAKRAVAALTWQVGRVLPDGVTLNALSPIAGTRMVARALAEQRVQPAEGGVDHNRFPAPEDMAPTVALLADDALGWCSGQVLFCGGSELSPIGAPQLVEVVRTDGVEEVGALLAAAVPALLVTAEAAQRTSAGANARLVFDGLPASPVSGTPPTCALAVDDISLARAFREALEAAGVKVVAMGASPPSSGWAGSAESLGRLQEDTGGLDAVVVAHGVRADIEASLDWREALATHVETADRVLAGAGWVRAAAEQTAAAGRPILIVSVQDATTPGGRSATQALAQLGRGIPDGRVNVIAIGVETARADPPLAALVAQLVGGDGATALRGAELVVDDGWIGLRTHPAPLAGVALGRPEIPPWVPGALREIVDA